MDVPHPSLIISSSSRKILKSLSLKCLIQPLQLCSPPIFHLPLSLYGSHFFVSIPYLVTIHSCRFTIHSFLASFIISPKQFTLSRVKYLKKYDLCAQLFPLPAESFLIVSPNPCSLFPTPEQPNSITDPWPQLELCVCLLGSPYISWLLAAHSEKSGVCKAREGVIFKPALLCRDYRIPCKQSSHQS